MTADVGLVVAEKRCRTCGETKPLTEFSRSRGRRDGLQSQCKPCDRDRAKESQRKRRERMGDEAYLKENREAVRRARQKPSVRSRGNAYKSAYNAALKSLRDQHPAQFDALFARERYDRGLT